MPAKKFIGTYIGGKVPDKLLDEFFKSASRLGVEKRRAIAAALLSFTKLPISKKRELSDEVYREYIEPVEE